MERKKRASFKTKELNTGFHIWSQITTEHKLKKDHIGKKVWVAGEFKTKERVLLNVHQKGERFCQKVDMRSMKLIVGSLDITH